MHGVGRRQRESFASLPKGIRRPICGVHVGRGNSRRNANQGAASRSSARKGLRKHWWVSPVCVRFRSDSAVFVVLVGRTQLCRGLAGTWLIVSVGAKEVVMAWILELGAGIMLEESATGSHEERLVMERWDSAPCMWLAMSEILWIMCWGWSVAAVGIVFPNSFLLADQLMSLY